MKLFFFKVKLFILISLNKRRSFEGKSLWCSHYMSSLPLLELTFCQIQNMWLNVWLFDVPIVQLLDEPFYCDVTMKKSANGCGIRPLAIRQSISLLNVLPPSLETPSSWASSPTIIFPMRKSKWYWIFQYDNTLFSQQVVHQVFTLVLYFLS